LAEICTRDGPVHLASPAGAAWSRWVCGFSDLIAVEGTDGPTAIRVVEPTIDVASLSAGVPDATCLRVVSTWKHGATDDVANAALICARGGELVSLLQVVAGPRDLSPGPLVTGPPGGIEAFIENGRAVVRAIDVPGEFMDCFSKLMGSGCPGTETTYGWSTSKDGFSVIRQRNVTVSIAALGATNVAVTPR
jgi:hypothetical protein